MPEFPGRFGGERPEKLYVAQVINWLVSLVTAGALIDYLVVCITYVNFYRAYKVQELERKSLPYYAYFQPYSAYIGIFFISTVLILYGYTAFGPPTVQGFFQNYTMQVLAPILYFGWKIFKKTKIVKLHEVDLVWEAPAIDAYEATFTGPPTGFWRDMLDMCLFWRKMSKQ